ncbi:hypothetical protein CU633_12135 [Bacillus sp. V3-13]|uniref:hypothetical protein n=1 Tax=Bacillus sp. V3-13 TaxID=2053728 RepID=UPI000C772B82|nr:hypothetical protein [Bacillus sp. V3-13]PLR77110.1 hypothetical protein CU633_12135 [Bacillus sp. V3-13]
MTIYDIAEVSINDQQISIGKGYLNVHDADNISSWDVDLFDDGRHEHLFDELVSNKEEVSLVIETKDGSSFVGRGLPTRLDSSPLGTTITLEGTGDLQPM